ncbi:MAG: FAD/NAD(P)-binding protein [Segniliparus sp.]|uniref:FAD/NAD(P)-binding protein n=1 Tax=Segniliparus sp. TaxID=2804064 RepID=UPI003F2B02DA
MTRVVVVGGGIGGVAAALALADKGHDVVVLERAREFREIGAGVQIAPNGMAVLERLGLGDEVAEFLVGVDSVRLFNATNGRLVAEMPFGEEYCELFGNLYSVVHRGELHQALVRAAARTSNIELRAASPVVGYEQDEHGVAALLDDGTRIGGEALIGADGVHSTIRAQLLADGPLTVRGIVVYRTVVPMEEIPAELRANAVTFWTGPGCHLVNYPIASGTVMNLAASDANGTTEVFSGEPVTREHVLDRLGALVGDARALLEHGKDWRMWTLMDREPADRWTDGRVALLGDGAHPMLHYAAQGACMALEDAVALADEFNPASIEASLAAYSELRKPRTAKVVLTARESTKLWHAEGAVAERRDEIMGAMSATELYDQVAWMHAGPEPKTYEVCVVGAGARGLAVVERICANERAVRRPCRIVVHVVDSAAPGTGPRWRADQSGHLLMNTVASHITVFADESLRIDGPVESGPTLYEWAKALPAPNAEAVSLTESSYPSRALYSQYLRDAFERIVQSAPAHVSIVTHRSKAVAMADADGFEQGPQGVRLEDGTRLNSLDAVILAIGHVPTRLSTKEAKAASLARIHGLRHVTPSNPTDMDLSCAKPGERVVLRGLGLNFFDYMALLTTGRGGKFWRGEDGVKYEPSGREPILCASSRRGLPHQARGVRQKGANERHVPSYLASGRIAQLRQQALEGQPAPSTMDLWPLISREAESIYYERILVHRGEEASGFVDRYLRAPQEELAALLEWFDFSPEQWFSWDLLQQPWGARTFTGKADFTAWALDYLRADVWDAKTGNVDSPLKAALDVFRDLLDEVRLIVGDGGLDGGAHGTDREDCRTPMSEPLSIGPPASRIEELVALVEAGVVELLGPGMRVAFDTADPAVIAESPLVPGSKVRSKMLIEARSQEPDLRRADDPLLRFLLDTGQCRPCENARGDGRRPQSGGLAVTERPYSIVRADGTAHPRRFAYGVSTESARWAPATVVRAGVGPVALEDADAIARAALALAPASHCNREVEI